MAAKDDFIKDIDSFFEGAYTVTKGTTIPDVSDIAFAKQGREIELAMMFIDIKESTKIVDGFRRVTAAKMYKAFLYGVTKIARSNGGELRSFNGDGVLIAFIGPTKCTNATKAALQMAWFIMHVLKPNIDSYLEKNQKLKDLNFDCGIGIDTGSVLVVRGGIRGENNNDLVWVGNATNYAVKLSALSKDTPDYHTYISKSVYNSLMDTSKLGGNPQKNMWEKRIWTAMNGEEIYRTRWTWSL